ncbi:hypothetical protein GRI75_10610 [Altererythrobacter soli]|uniref:Uncharacterized protein n=1 Tax=Croceibacterium soli TaxID=1739690 RepID=A0A6I4UTH9_9SPHN|nr:hypothetical protein [Croceibacterium soli]MXP42091.1 hypothetical protein [Croceibacterium soli]
MARPAAQQEITQDPEIGSASLRGARVENPRMLTLGLEELFTPELLQAFRERWGASPEVSAAEAREIMRQLVEPTEREEFVTKLVLCLVGEEPDFHAWMEAFAVGSFELRPNVKYAQPGKAGVQPARFYKEQQKLIDDVADKQLTPEEKAKWRHAYDDALRLIVASQVLKELRVGVAAKAALGAAWPLMMAAARKSFSQKNQKLLHYFGDEPAFIAQLEKAITATIQGWIDTHHGGHAPSVRNYSPDYAKVCPGGLSEYEIAVQLDPATRAVDAYRSAIFEALEAPDEPDRTGPYTSDPRELAQQDVPNLRDRVGPRREAAKTRFSQYTPDVAALSYSAAERERLRRMLPVLAHETCESPHFTAARDRGSWRAHVRYRSSEILSDNALQEEIAGWVTQGLPPPPDLKVEFAAYFEEEVCYQFHHGFMKVSDAWAQPGFATPGSQRPASF